MIFETHAHYDDERFTEDRDQLLSAMPEKGIKRIINVGASIRRQRQRWHWQNSMILSMQRLACIQVTFPG